MQSLKTDLSIFGKLNLEKPPVGVMYLFRKPEGIKQLDKKLALCEMLGEAQQRKEPFYFTRENETCFGAQTIGMAGEGGPSPSFAASGELGVKLEIWRSGSDHGVVGEAEERKGNYHPNDNENGRLDKLFHGCVPAVVI